MKVEAFRPCMDGTANVMVMLSNGEIHKCDVSKILRKEDGSFYVKDLLSEKKNTSVKLNRKQKRAKRCVRCGQKFQVDKTGEFRLCACGIHTVG